MRKKIELKIINPLLGTSIPLPTYATEQSAGLDLRACIDKPIILEPGETQLINSGIAIFINDPGIMFTVVPRSGIGFKNGIVLGNLTGIIDSDYQNEIFIGLWNRSRWAFTINPGDRICQGIFVPIIQVDFDVVEEFSNKTERHLGGFGSSGIK